MRAGREHRSKIERCRKHAHDGCGSIVESDGAPDNCGSAAKRCFQSPSLSKTALGAFHLHSSAVNKRPNLRLYAEEREKVLRNRQCVQSLGFSMDGQFAIAFSVERKVCRHIRK